MSYMRGNPYIWGDGERTHISYEDGMVSVPDQLLDAFVAMRWAEMSDREKQSARALAAARGRGNAGADALMEEMGLPTFLDILDAIVRDAQ